VAGAAKYADLAANDQGTSITLQAQWVINRYTVTYHGNGHTAGSAPAPVTHDYGENAALENQGTLAKTGHTFLGWAADSSANAPSYTPGDMLAVESDVVLYAVWSKDTPPAPRFTVTYHANGGTGEVPVDESQYLSGSVATILGSGNLALAGYTFSGWSVGASARSAGYRVGDTLLVAGDVHLYAVWTKDEVAGEEPPEIPEEAPAADPPTPPEKVVVNDPPKTPEEVVVSEPPEEEVAEEPPEVPEDPAPDPATNTNMSVGAGTAIVADTLTDDDGLSPSDIEKITLQSGNLFIDLANGNVPLGNPGVKGAWSLLSLIFSVMAVAIVISLFFGRIQRRKEQLLRMLAIMAGSLTLLVWLILDDVGLLISGQSQPTAWVDKWTLFIGALFAAQVALFLAYRLRLRSGKQR
jgi:uncharacterized repeat protein (TIGR02543 family)